VARLFEPTNLGNAPLIGRGLGDIPMPSMIVARTISYERYPVAEMIAQNVRKELPGMASNNMVHGNDAISADLSA
jgi:hypothetical protein